jgi:LysM repeat protein
MTSLSRSRSAAGLLTLGLAASVLTGCGLGGSNTKKTTTPTTAAKAKGAATTAPPAASTAFATIAPIPTSAPPATPAPGSAGTALGTGAPQPGTGAAPGVTQPAAAPAPPGTKYVVKAGDIPSRIAQAMGVTTQALLDANGLTAKDFIKVGQELVVPSGGTLPAGGTIAPPAAAPGAVPTTVAPGGAPAAGSSKYTVVANDSWYGIAKKFGVSADALLAANKATTKTVITPGQVIVIPGKAAAAPAVTTTVKKP